MKRSLTWLSCLVLFACQGEIDGRSTNAPQITPQQDEEHFDPKTCGTVDVGYTPLRRLTRDMYDNVMRDVLGDESNPGARLLSDDGSNADTRSISVVGVREYMAAAEDISNRNLSSLMDKFSCESPNETCAQNIVNGLSPRLLRRQVSDSEREAYIGLYREVANELSAEEGIKATIEALTQSFEFLYRTENGDKPNDELTNLNAYEVASRLAFFLWRSAPDDELLALAENREILKDDVLETQARRLLDDPKAYTSVRHFFHRWLRLEELDDEVAAGNLSKELATSMIEETERFVFQLFFNDGTWQELITSTQSEGNALLAEHYGLSGNFSDAFQPISHSEIHSGILTQASVVASKGRSPVMRGLFIRSKLFCGEPPPPPEGLEVVPPVPEEGQSLRAAHEAHRSDPVCASCHRLMDPLGFAYEKFDRFGQEVHESNGTPIDSSGQLVETDVDGAFDDIRDLGSRIAESDDAVHCFSKYWYEFVSERVMRHADKCAAYRMKNYLQSHDLKLKELLISVVLDPTFRLRRFAAEDSK